MNTKWGVVVAAAVIGSGLGLWAWQHGRKAHKPVDAPLVDRSEDREAGSKSPTDPPIAIRTEPPALGHAEASSPVAPSADAPAMPALPMSGMGSEETGRSFHAKPETTAPPELKPPVSAADPAEKPKAEEPPAREVSLPPVSAKPSSETTPTMPDLASLSQSSKEPESTATTMKPLTAPPTSKPAATKATVHVIASGETYSSLAEKYLGSSKYAHLIVKANPGKDPRKLLVGAKINIPAAPKEALAKASATENGAALPTKGAHALVESGPPVPTEHAYKVQPGESWNDIARRFLGDAKRWTELYELNKERVPRNPEGLKAGMVIELPAGVKATTRPS